MLCYLAQPIDRGSSSNKTAARSVRSSLISEGFSVFQPAEGWGATLPVDSRVQPLNLEVLARADCMVAVFLEGSQSFGVPYEVAWAQARSIPVVVVSDIPDSTVIKSTGLPVFHPYYADRAAAKCREMAVSPVLARWQQMPAGQPPRVGKPGDAGLDLTYSGDTPMVIDPGEMVNVPAGIGVEFPAGYWCMLVGRSSTFQRQMFVAPSIIDAGYRGPLFACVWNFSQEQQVILPGDRVAQIVPFELVADRFQWKEEDLTGSERGASGFGSTGR